MIGFEPTKTWIKLHKKPKDCFYPEDACYNVFDWMEKNNGIITGFCVGIVPDAEDMDIVRFCTCSPRVDEEGLMKCSHLWHPSEAQLVAVMLSMATGQIWSMLPSYRKTLGNMRREKTKLMKRIGSK